MRRNLTSRIFTTALTAWLAVCLLEPMQLHLCSTHGGLAIKVTTAAARSTSGDAAPRHAAHSHHGDDPTQNAEQCSCLGDCSKGNAPPAVIASEIGLETAVTIAGTDSFPHASASYGTPDFILPFSNGPPTVS